MISVIESEVLEIRLGGLLSLCLPAMAGRVINKVIIHQVIDFN